MSFVGRLKGIEYILKELDKSEDSIKESLEAYLDYCKSELELTNNTLISE